MKSGFKTLAALLAILGAYDLVMIPFMIAANHTHAGTPPAAAIVLNGVMGVTVLATIPAIMQGRVWAFWVSVACQIVDMVQALLGIVAGPGLGFAIVGALAMVVSVPALVLLFRLKPRRAVVAAS
jgi:hypothetical protein